MKDAIDEILHELSVRGYRITKAREELLATFVKLHEPISILELSQKVHADEASVYRNVKILEKEGFLEEITLQGSSSRFALKEGHHHHIVCTICGHMSHIPCTPKKEDISVPSGFSKIFDHEVTYYGLCSKCA